MWGRFWGWGGVGGYFYVGFFGFVLVGLLFFFLISASLFSHSEI